MKPQLSKYFLLSAVLGSTMMSCSKEQDASPAVQAVSTTAEVQVVNSRLVFSSQAAFERTVSALEKQLADPATGSQALDKWEHDLHFTSLRTAAAAQSSHLEELTAQQQPATEYELQASFGFPTFYATLISPAGEYQIGSKIYWFHEGFKYEAASQEELAAIKQNPLSAKVKYAAGTKLPKGATLPNGRAYAGMYTVDDRFHYEFPLNNDPGSQRRISYHTSVYVEDRGTDPGRYRHQFYTTLSLLINYDYYNNYYRTWYPAQGRGSQIDWTTAINFTGTAASPSTNIAPSPSNTNLNRSFSFDNGVVSLLLGSGIIYTNASPQDYTVNDIYWDYQITGSINAFNDADRAHYYYVDSNNMSSGVLW